MSRLSGTCHFCPSGGGGGGGTVTSVNGKVGAVVLTAADVGADAAGTAAAAIAAHVAALDPHPQYTDAAEAAAAAPVQSVFGRVGAVIAVAADYTAAQVASTGPSTVQADLDALVAVESRVSTEHGDQGNRTPGAALRSGGDVFANLTPANAIGQASRAVTIREVAWRRNIFAAGFFRISVVDAALNEVAFTLVPAPALQGAGSTTGLAIPVPTGGAVGVYWDTTSSGTTQNPTVTVYAELT